MKKYTNTIKAIIVSSISILSVLWIFSRAANPSFSINPSTLTGKLHCEYRFYMVLNSSWMWYNAFESTIAFDSWSALITHEAINPLFNNITENSLQSWYLYNARGTMLPWQTSTSTLTNALTFRFKTTQNITGTALNFVTLSGDTILFDPNLTDDWATINASWSSYDILTGITNWVYTFIALPCVPDTHAPSMQNNYPSNGNRYIPNNATITMTLYDRAGAGNVNGPAPLATNNRQHYWYSWNDISNLSNYVPAPSNVDNQEWVNSGTIHISVACPTCAWWDWWSYTFTPADPALSINERNGSTTYNKLTRQNKIRWYELSLPAPAPYEVEKEIYVNVSVTDNPNENNQTHTATPSFSFNSPQNPIITKISPAESSNISPTISPFVFTFIDDWAGIDTWTISITIPEYSSWTKFYTGHVYSWSELGIILMSWLPGLGNSGSYEVSFTPLRPFPSNTNISITGSVYDLAGNKGTYTSQFTTAMSCLDWWCADTFTVNVLWWIYSWLSLFTGSLIQITWTNINSPYPYLTGINNDILMCWLPYNWTILTWNIWIFDTFGTSLKGTTYNNENIYITGMEWLNFTYDNGTIIIY